MICHFEHSAVCFVQVAEPLKNWFLEVFLLSRFFLFEERDFLTYPSREFFN